MDTVDTAVDVCTIVIATSDVLPAAQERVSSLGGEILGFNEAQALQALEAGFKRKPGVVALERRGAGTAPRRPGLNRTQAGPPLRKTAKAGLAHRPAYTR